MSEQFAVFEVPQIPPTEPTVVPMAFTTGTALDCVRALLWKLTHAQLTELRLTEIGRVQREKTRRAATGPAVPDEETYTLDECVIGAAPPESINVLDDDADDVPLAPEDETPLETDLKPFEVIREEPDQEWL